MCPDEEAWVRFLDREEAGRDELDAHLARCRVCRELLGALAKDMPSVVANDGPTMEQAIPHGRIGAIVAGKWRIEALAGAGGMGRVYRARHQNGHQVAIKYLHPKLANDPEVVRRFRREGYVANRVEHPAIVKVLDDGDDGGPFLVMELLDGRSCRTKLRAEGPFSPDEALTIVEAAARAIAAAHHAGIVHRDIKPDNIFLTASGEVRVLDFGLASARGLVSAESMTTDGITLGTVGYMSPEQARGDNADVTARADVWSLAATALTLMTGRGIHGGRTPAEQLAFAVTQKAPPVRTLITEISPEVARVLDRALSFDAKARHADAAELADELARARARAKVPRHRRSGSLTVALGAGALLVGIVALASGRTLPAASSAPSVEPSVGIGLTSSAPPASSAAPPSEVVAVDAGGERVTAVASIRRAPQSRSVPPPRADTRDDAGDAPSSSSTARDPLLPRF